MGTERSDGEITTERLRLRRLALDDAPQIQGLCGELAVARWLARVPHPYPPGAAERFIELVHASGECAWAIERREEPGLIGVIGLDGPHGRQSLGYWLGTAFWGKGYASEAARAVVERAFRLGADALASGAFVGNAASLRVQEKLGFGVTGQRWLRCEALRRDLPHIDTRLTRTDWETRA